MKMRYKIRVLENHFVKFHTKLIEKNLSFVPNEMA